jgi:hypothetical protein
MLDMSNAKKNSATIVTWWTIMPDVSIGGTMYA